MIAKILEGMVKVKDYVPFFQTFTWALLAGIGGFVFRRQLLGLVETVRKRIESGSSLKAGPIEVGADLRDLTRVEPHTATAVLTDSDAASVDVLVAEPTSPKALLNATPTDEVIDTTAAGRAQHRDSGYQRYRGIFLAHVISPSRDPNQLYDIFVYLIRHRSEDFADVDHAEFFFGKYWGNEIFREDNDGGVIGLATSAYGPFLCTCLVVFKDGYQVMLERYIDFEMGKYLPPGTENLRGRQYNARRRV